MLVPAALDALVAVRRAEAPRRVTLAVVQALHALPGKWLAVSRRVDALRVTRAAHANETVRVTPGLRGHRTVVVALTRYCATFREQIADRRPLATGLVDTFDAPVNARIAVRATSSTLLVRIASELRRAPERRSASVARRRRRHRLVRRRLVRSGWRRVETDGNSALRRQQNELAAVAACRYEPEKRNERSRRHPAES